MQHKRSTTPHSVFFIDWHCLSIDPHAFRTPWKTKVCINCCVQCSTGVFYLLNVLQFYVRIWQINSRMRFVPIECVIVMHCMSLCIDCIEYICHCVTNRSVDCIDTALTKFVSNIYNAKWFLVYYNIRLCCRFPIAVH